MTDFAFSLAQKIQSIIWISGIFSNSKPSQYFCTSKWSRHISVVTTKAIMKSSIFHLFFQRTNMRTAHTDDTFTEKIYGQPPDILMNTLRVIQFFSHFWENPCQIEDQSAPTKNAAENTRCRGDRWVKTESRESDGFLCGQHMGSLVLQNLGFILLMAEILNNHLGCK